MFAIVTVHAARTGHAQHIAFAATTRMPSRAWVAQQLRNATPLGVAPKFSIRGRDDKFGTVFRALALATGIRVTRTAVRATTMNAICGRFLGSLRRGCRDQIGCLTTSTRSAWSPGASATSTPHAVTKGASAGPRSRAECPATGKSSRCPCLAARNDYRRAAWKMRFRAESQPPAGERLSTSLASTTATTHYREPLHDLPRAPQSEPRVRPHALSSDSDLLESSRSAPSGTPAHSAISGLLSRGSPVRVLPGVP